MGRDNLKTTENLFKEKNNAQTKSIYVSRTFGGDCNNRASDGVTTAGTGGGKETSPGYDL
jgi:hypothetical protein